MQDPQQQQWLLEPGGIASRLRALQGKTPGVEFAAKAGMRPSKVSKLRLGQQLPTEDDIRAWVSAGGAPTSVADELIEVLEEAPQHHSTFTRRLASGQTQMQREFNELVEQSDIIRMFERSFMPRLLQTHDYAKAILQRSATRHLAHDDVPEAVAVRLDSQRFLHDGKRRLEVVLDETVLSRRVVSPALMYTQVERILAATAQSNVRMGILPTFGDIHDVPINSFVLYGEICYVEGYPGDIPRPSEEWPTYKTAFANLWQDAKEGDEAREIITKVMKRHAADMVGQ